MPLFHSIWLIFISSVGCEYQCFAFGLYIDSSYSKFLFFGKIEYCGIFKGRTFPYDACHRSLATLPARFGPYRPWLLTNLDLLLHDFNELVKIDSLSIISKQYFENI